MATYMGQGLLDITTNAIQSTNPEVAKQGLEFWTTVADEEVELMYEAEEAASAGAAPEVSSQNYCQGALSHGLVPLVLDSLAKQDEGDDEVGASLVPLCINSCHALSF
eukprot:m.209945 g.209945  ORF g.209945 m.209945 type:complete len:108 (+) comp17142_c0_seq67:222-545(+)